MKQQTASETIREAVMALAKTGQDFTADYINVPSGFANAIGPTIQRMVSEGLIIDTKRTENSTRPEKKGRLQRVFRAGPFLDGTSTNGGSREIFDKLVRARGALEALGYKYEMSMLAKMLLSIDARHFLIVSGISGIGKSSVVSLLATAIGAEFVIEPVMPQWTDPTEIIGYYDITLQAFTPGSFLRTLKALEERSIERAFYLLDEMNLAHVEYYLSPFLSISEIPGAKIEPFVPNVKERDEIVKRFAVAVAESFYLFGTINVDETTKAISPKVLDRAFVIEINDFEFSDSAPETDRERVREHLKGAFDLLPERRSFSAPAQARQAEMLGFLEALYTILRPINRHFGNRVVQDCSRVIGQWHDCGLQAALSLSQVVDFVLLSRILPKLQGTSSDLPTLRRLREYLGAITEFSDSNDGRSIELVDSIARIDGMIGQAELLQIYSFWA